MPEGSNYYQRQWTPVVERPPLRGRRVRSWDLAATLPSEVNPNPDWTAGVRLSQCLDDNLFYVEHVERFRDRPAEVERKLLDTAIKLDGKNILTTVPQDPGSAGKSYCMQLLRKLLERGYRAKARATNKDKVTRFAPFSAACEAGLVRVVKGDWNEAFFQELESFTGDGKTKDDQVDAVADCFMSLAETKNVPTPSMGSQHSLRQEYQLAKVKR